MRNIFCQGLLRLYERKRFVFMTGDLGFNVLEPLKEKMGNDFINAGIAEQNMISVSAGLSIDGHDVWVYSIAPFCYARPFEQIRNDICLHKNPVKLVGNGGGYGYGVMGSSHHAIEDYGVMVSLQGMRAFVPAFASDVEPVIDKLSNCSFPAYLRLGLSELKGKLASSGYAPWRKILTGNRAVMLVVGTLAGPIIEKFAAIDEKDRPELWVLTELPIDEVPDNFLSSLRSCGKLIVVEEHVKQGSAGQMLVHRLCLDGNAPEGFSHLYAKGYPSGRYGSQNFHRAECGINASSAVKAYKEIL